MKILFSARYVGLNGDKTRAKGERPEEYEEKCQRN